MEDNSGIIKKPKTKIIVLIVIVMILVGLCIYLIFINKSDKDNNDKKGEDILVIAQDKLNQATNFWNVFKSSSNCKDSIKQGFCYYDTLGNFNKHFYNIYSKKLSYNDVFNEYSVSGYIKSPIINTYAAEYIIANNIVYVKNSCVNRISTKVKGDYEIVSNTSDTVVIKYVLEEKDEYTSNINNHDAEMTLVKENDEWRIFKADIFSSCGSSYTISIRENHIMDISYSEYKGISKSDQYNIFLVTSPTCSHCQNYKPQVELVAKENNLMVYDINVSDLKYDEYIELHDSYSALKDNYSQSDPVIPTPVTIITKNGKEVASILGDRGQSGFIKLLKDNGVIK